MSENKLCDPILEQMTLSKINTAKAAAKLIIEAGGDLWGNHPDYSTESWKDEVMNGSTRQGYWEWVFNQIEEVAS